MKSISISLRKILCTAIFACFFAISFNASAQQDFLTDEELNRAFKDAVKHFQQKQTWLQNSDSSRNKAQIEIPTAKILEEDDDGDTIAQIKKEIKTTKPVDISTETTDSAKEGFDDPRIYNKPLEDIVVAVNMENKTLKEIVNSIIEEAAEQTGEWKVKWRLKKENRHIMEEKVNLTAETSFKKFMDYLTERVRNMSGISLFVTTFETSRIIIISDTYY